MPDRNYNDRNRPNAIERDRMERRRQLRRKSMISNALVVGIIAVVAIGIVVAIITFTGKNKASDAAEPTAVTATIASATQPKATTAPKPTQSSSSGQYGALTSSQEDYQSDNNDNDSSSSSQTSSSAVSSSPSSGMMSGGGSNTLHYTASGQTSYGYDWTYSGGGGIVGVDCSYNFDTHTYDFSITGLSEGVTTLTLYYNTDDGIQQPVNMTVSVDGNLNVTQIG